MTTRKPPGRRLASLLLTLTLLLTLVPALDTPARAEEQAATGLGTQHSPYVVYTYEQLWNAMDYQGDATGKEYIKLGCDIDTSTENSGYGLAPNKAIQMHTYNLNLDLNGHTLTIKSSEWSFQAFILQTGNMTICDGSSGGGTIRYTHARAGDRQLIRIVGGYTLTLKDGVTLEVDATSHGACINAVLWLSGNAHAVIENANLLYVGDRSGETANPRNWSTGVLVEDSATLTIHDGEFTRVVVNKPPVVGGDKDPSVVINGGVFRRPLAIFAGNTLNNYGPLTLPIRINGGVFHRIDEPRDYYKQDGEEQFYIYMKPGSEENFLNFINPVGSTKWEAEASECMKTMQRSLFPEDAVIRLDDAPDFYQSGGIVLDIGDLSFIHTFRDIWLQSFLRCMEEDSAGEIEYSYPDKIEVYSGLFGMKAEYGGEDALTGTPADPIITDLTENSDLKVTWNTKLPADLAKDFGLAMYYVQNKNYYPLTGTGNSDGTRTATVVLPGVTSGNNYQVSFALILAAKNVADPTVYPSALAGKTLWLRSLKTQTINGGGYPYWLSGPLKAGDTVGPDIVGRTTFDSAVLAEQGPWTFNTGEESSVPVSEQKPIPAGRDCYKKVTLNAKPGYRFDTTNPPSIVLQAPDSSGSLGSFRLKVSADGKTATGEVKVTSTATYDELKLTIPNVKAGNVAPTDQRSIFGLPEGITPEGNINWKEDYGSGTTYLEDGDQFYAGHTYRCELYLHPGEGVTVPETVKATINGITAYYEGGYLDGNFTLTSKWFKVPDPRTPIGEITLRVEDDPFNYLTGTVLLTPLSSDVTQTVSQWYNEKGEPVNSGSLPPNAPYSYTAVYEPRSGFRFEPDGFRVKIAGENGYLSNDRITVTDNRLEVRYDFTIPPWNGTTIEGAVYSYGDPNDPITVTMDLQDGTTISGVITDDPTGTGEYLQHYFLAGVPAGTHTMKVSKAGHETYVWEVEILEGFPALRQTVYLHLLGSANVRGQVTSYGGNKTYEVKLAPLDGQVVRHLGFRGDQSSGLVTDEFEVEYAAPGAYDLKIYKLGHLTYTITNVVVKDGKAVDLAPVTLLCGDLNGDGFINSTDLGIVLQGQNYGKAVGASDVNPLTDLNGDGWVNSTDLGIILQGQHYGKSASADCTTNYGGGA